MCRKIIELVAIMKFRLGLVVTLVRDDILDEPPLPCLSTVTQQLYIGLVLDVGLIHDTCWSKIQL